MRLVCPNCGAQYEVDDRVIPETGRDVQCSACGHGWYQMPAGREDEIAEEAAVDDEQLTGDEPDETGALETGPEPDEDEIDEQPAPPPATAAKPREVDEGVRSILQEEAQRELEARAIEPAHEPEQVETQPDLGLDAGPSPEDERRRIARERMARMRGLDEDDLPEPEPDFDAHAEPVEAPAKPTQGRDLFPDIEEINSTLDSHAPGAKAGGDGGEAAAKRSGGFGRGFTLILFLAVLLLSLYVVAPRLAQTVPALEPVLTAYVEAVNGARVWLDTVLRGLIEKIEAAAGDGN
jgi:predicted Zn finger-like uncharacterized protein